MRTLRVKTRKIKKFLQRRASYLQNAEFPGEFGLNVKRKKPRWRTSGAFCLDKED